MHHRAWQLNPRKLLISLKLETVLYNLNYKDLLRIIKSLFYVHRVRIFVKSDNRFVGGVYLFLFIFLSNN